MQLVKNSVKEVTEMENEFLNTTKLYVNLKNYTNTNLFYNYDIKYSISLTESQQEIMLLIQSSSETFETAIQYHDILKRSIKSENKIQMVELYISKQCKL